jgi:hypothetical protein
MSRYNFHLLKKWVMTLITGLFFLYVSQYSPFPFNYICLVIAFIFLIFARKIQFSRIGNLVGFLRNKLS